MNTGGEVSIWRHACCHLVPLGRPREKRLGGGLYDGHLGSILHHSFRFGSRFFGG